MILTQDLLSETTLRCDISGRAAAALVTIPKSLASASNPSTFYDSTISENVSATVWNEFEIIPTLGAALTIENLSATQTLTDNIVAPVGDGGVGRVQVTDGSVKKFFRTDTTKRGEGTLKTFTAYTAGTVSKYLFDQVDALISGTPDAAYYSAYNHTSATYTRNASCWLADIDLSCVAVASNSGSGWTRQRGGTLITPRVIIIARHFAYGVGTQVRFSNASGTVENRTVIAVDSASGGDISVCVLDAAVTVATPCTIAGDWMIQGASVTANSKTWYSGGLGFHIDQNARVYACSLGRATFLLSSFTTSITANGITFSDCESSAFSNHSIDVIGSGNSAYLKTPISGDSGQPVFVIIDGDPVLLWCWLYPTGGPPVYRHNGALLNAIIASACTNAGISAQTVTVAPDPTL
jgi:hypothetical protein